MDKLDPVVKRTATALITGALAVVFDSTIVSVALQALADDLDASVATIQWVSTAYLLALFVTIPVAGWAQHRFGGKRLWLVSLGIFLAGSVLCSLAWDAPSLIAFRVVQGLGGGLMLPLMTTMLMQAAAGRSLGRLMAVVSLPVMAGPVLGPVLGGVILNQLDWPWLFWVNVPFCVAGIILAVRLLPADGPRTPARLDVPGLALVVPGVIAILYALTNVTSPGGFERVDVLLPLTGGVALLVAFVAWAVRRAGDALVDVRLLRHRPLASASVLMFLSGAALYGAMLLLPLFYQQVRGADALAAGLMLVPQGVGTLLSRSLAGRFTDRLGPRVVSAAGFALVALSTVPFAFSDTASNTWLLAAVLLLRGAGLGAVMIPLMSAAFVGLDRPEVPHASIITRVAQQLGGSFGVAVLAVILHGAAQDTTGPAAAFQESFWWAVGFTAFAVLVSLLLPGRPEPEPAPEPEAQPAAVGAALPRIGGSA